jgi:hypothetical protein
MDRQPDTDSSGPDAPRSPAAQPPDDVAEQVTEAFGSPDEPSESSPPAEDEPEDPDAHGSIVPM